MTAYMLRYAPRLSTEGLDTWFSRPITFYLELESGVHLLATYSSSFDQRLVDRLLGDVLQRRPVVPS